MIRLIKPYIEFNEVNNEFKEIFQSGIFTRGKYSAQLPLGLMNILVVSIHFLLPLLRQLYQCV